MPSFCVTSVKRSWAGFTGFGVGIRGGKGLWPQVATLQKIENNPRSSATARLLYEPNNIFISDARTWTRSSWRQEFRRRSYHGRAAVRHLAKSLLVDECLADQN